MGKSQGSFTPKALSNRMKAKGLTKLQFYCQACQKACRDANGFKCHVMSESHQRQLLVVGENKNKVVGSYSSEFRSGFLSILSRRHGTKRVLANQVYQEYIQDRHHVHMNATAWSSLAGFVRTLGKQGVCKIEESERGWWITWIDSRPETMAKQAAVQKLERMKKDDEERDQEMLKEQIERAAKIAEERGMTTETQSSELKRDDEKGKIKLNFSLKPVETSVKEAPKGDGKMKMKMMMGGLQKKPSLSALAKKSAISSSKVTTANSLGKRKSEENTKEDVKRNRECKVAD